jgi:imidazoleglycerol-phosphate dehydratase
VGDRKSVIKRETAETNIHVELDIDGSGRRELNTGLRMFDHLLSQLTQHGLFDITVSATGDDQHHLVEDVAICLGRAFGEALGGKQGIVRMADASVPMDEALATVAIDISGRGYAVLDLALQDTEIAALETDLIRHFLESFACEARLNLHVRVLYGQNDHHKAEAVFKALGRTLGAATRIDARLGGLPPSTKGLLEE